MKLGLLLLSSSALAIDCPIGKVPFSDTLCGDCAPGYIKNSQIATQCDKCPDFQFSLVEHLGDSSYGRVKCSVCPDNQIFVNASRLDVIGNLEPCNKCPIGMERLNARGDITCQVCQYGFIPRSLEAGSGCVVSKVLMPPKMRLPDVDPSSSSSLTTLSTTTSTENTSVPVIVSTTSVFSSATLSATTSTSTTSDMNIPVITALSVALTATAEANSKPRVAGQRTNAAFVSSQTQISFILIIASILLAI